MKALIRVVGVMLVAAGILFAAQGASYVHWPAESFMLDQRVWVGRGFFLMLIGAALIITARRRRN